MRSVLKVLGGESMAEGVNGRTYDALGDGLADGVDLGGVTTTTHADADVDTGCDSIIVSA